QQDILAGLKLVNETCASCHGEHGAGGDRAPALVDSIRLRKMTDTQIAGIIRDGTAAGMPPFPLSEEQLAQVVAYIRARNPSAVRESPPEQVAAGERYFFGKGQCASCHMVRGRGGVNGPDLSDIAIRATFADLEAI